MANAICHWEIIGSAKLKDFYSQIFDWQYQPMHPGYDYIPSGDEKNPVGGGLGQPEGDFQPGLYIYISVDDLQATLDKVTAAGGTVVLPPMPIPNVGSIAMFADPDGTVVGIWKGN